MKEFDLIRRLREMTAVADPAAAGVTLGIGDDAAVLQVPAGHDLVAATDTLNAGTHFPSDTAPRDIAYKCLAVNLSDLASMGASPRWALLSLALPGAGPHWVHSFARGFNELARAHGVALVGGDTTAGPLSVCLTALGVVERGRQMQRDGAAAGQLLVVSGTIGGAARVLDLLGEGQAALDRTLLDRPQPRVALGQSLAGFASACIDISDGLLADLGHLLKASGCGARVQLEDLPHDDLLVGLPEHKRWNYQLSGGDDYELLFTLPKRFEPMLAEWQQGLCVRLTVIGETVAGEGVQCVAPGEGEFEPADYGFEHFRRPL
jgi:thiamine-monophosphate kinase